MLQGIVSLLSGVFYSIVLGLICVIFTDKVEPMVVTLMPISPSSPLFATYSQLGMIILLILFIPLETAGLSIIYFFMRTLKREREEY